MIRILPPYWVMTTLLFALATWHPELLGASRADWVEYLKSLLFIPYQKSNGLIRPLLFVGWSLNYEMFFYFCLTLGLFFFRKRPLIGASGLILLTMACCYPLAHRNVIFDFYSSGLMREFILGIVAYELAKRISAETAGRYRMGALAGVAVALLLLLYHHAVAPVHWLSHEWAYTGVLSSIIVLGASVLSQGGWDMRIAWIVLVGDASYILYLVHPYVELFADRILIPRVHLLEVIRPEAHLAAVLATVPIAIAMHLWLEKPTVNYLNGRFGGRRRSTEMSGQPASPAEVAPQAEAS